MSRNYKNNKNFKDKEHKLKRKSLNDWTDYFTSEEQAKQLCNIAFTDFIGETSTLEGLGTYETAGIMAIYLNPSLPTVSGSVLDALDTAALANWETISATNNKSTIYQRGDVTTLIAAECSLLSMVSFMSRPFGLWSNFSERNRLYPKKLFTAMGIDADDFFAHIADYRSQFNVLISAMEPIQFPASIRAFKVCSNVFSNIYIDDKDSSMAQTYMFVPDTLWQISDTYGSHGSGCYAYDIAGSGPKTFDQYITRLQTMIKEMTDNSIFNAIYADFLRMNEKSGMQLMTVDQIPDNYRLEPIADDEIRLWLNNMTMFGAPFKGKLWYGAAQSTNFIERYGNDFFVDETTGKVVYTPTWTSTAARTVCKTPLLNFMSDNPSTEDIVEASRLLTYIAYDNGATYRSGVSTDSDPLWVSNDRALHEFYATKITIYDGTNTAISLSQTYNGASSTLSSAQTRMKWVDRLTKFKWCPRIYLVEDNGLDIIGDLQYYTLVDKNWIKKEVAAEPMGWFMIR